MDAAGLSLPAGESTPDPQTPDPQTPDPQTPDPQTPDPQTPDPQTPDPQTHVTTALAPTTTTLIQHVAWISGAFRYEHEGMLVEEQWLDPAGDVMLGMSRTLSGDRVVSYEFLQLRQEGKSLVYIAQPNGHCPGTRFEAHVDVSDGKTLDVVEFVNPHNDFPKKITYQRQGPSAMRATISNDKQTISFDYRRDE